MISLEIFCGRRDWNDTEIRYTHVYTDPCLVCSQGLFLKKGYGLFHMVRIFLWDAEQMGRRKAQFIRKAERQIENELALEGIRNCVYATQGYLPHMLKGGKRVDCRVGTKINEEILDICDFVVVVGRCIGDPRNLKQIFKLCRQKSKAVVVASNLYVAACSYFDSNALDVSCGNVTEIAKKVEQLKEQRGAAG